MVFWKPRRGNVSRKSTWLTGSNGDEELVVGFSIRELLKWHWQGQFPRRSQSQSVKTVGLREKRMRIGDIRAQSRQGVSLQGGTRGRSNSLRRGGVAGGFLRMGEVTHVCVWTGMIQESRSNWQSKRDARGDGCSLGVFIRNAKIFRSQGAGSRRFDSEKRGRLWDIWNFLSMDACVSGAQLLNLNISFFDVVRIPELTMCSQEYLIK